VVFGDNGGSKAHGGEIENLADFLSFFMACLAFLTVFLLKRFLEKGVLDF